MSAFECFIARNKAVIEALEERFICELDVSVESGNITGHGMVKQFTMILNEENVTLFGEDEEVRFNSTEVIFSLFELAGSGVVKPGLDIKYFSVADEGYVDKSTYYFTGEDTAQSMLNWYLSEKKSFDIPDTSDDIAERFFKTIEPIV
tara:strand:+ start:122 stop:565 length:444 start_codon:yes stop_codon:yes gene_type:complete